MTKLNKIIILATIFVLAGLWGEAVFAQTIIKTCDGGGAWSGSINTIQINADVTLEAIDLKFWSTGSYTVTIKQCSSITGCSCGGEIASQTFSSVSCNASEWCNFDFINDLDFSSGEYLWISPGSANIMGCSGDCCDDSTFVFGRCYTRVDGSIVMDNTRGIAVRIYGELTSVPQNYDLNVYKGGAGAGTVTGSGINCGTDCSHSYSDGTSVTLAANPNPGSEFAGWSGGGCSGTGICGVTMNSDKTVTATFNVSAVPATDYNLTVANISTDPGAGTVTGPNIDCGTDCSQDYDPDTSVTLTAVAFTGYEFVGWSGACSAFGSGTTCNLTMDATKIVIATFDVSSVNYSPSITNVTHYPDPVAIGSNITFNVGWIDLNPGDQVKAHICKTDDINASAQSCTDESWCDSTDFSGSSISCTNPIPITTDVDTYDYYAFVCDEDNACSGSWSGIFTTNAAPAIISVDHSPDPVSARNSLTFIVDWSDPDDQVKAHICKTDDLDVPTQTCTGGIWCDSDFYGTSPIIGTYSTIDADIGTNNYYVFICDDDNVCSDSLSGTFAVQTAPAVNWPPTIAVVDSPNRVTAGDSITFTAYWSDPNGDQAKIHICKTDDINASAQTCVGGSWCHSTAFSGSPTGCTYLTTAGDIGTPDYYAFVCDDNNTCSVSYSKNFTVRAAAPNGGSSVPGTNGETLLQNPLEAGSLSELLDYIIDFIFWVGMALAPVLLIVAGLLFVTAAGNPGRIDTAKRVIFYTVIGLAVLLLAKGLVITLKAILGG